MISDPHKQYPIQEQKLTLHSLFLCKEPLIAADDILVRSSPMKANITVSLTIRLLMSNILLYNLVKFTQSLKHASKVLPQSLHLSRLPLCLCLYVVEDDINMYTTYDKRNQCYQKMKVIRILFIGHNLEQQIISHTLTKTQPRTQSMRYN